MSNKLKMITDIVPLVVFFVVHKFYGIIYATGSVVVSTLLATIYVYYVERTVPKSTLVVCIMSVFLGGLTILTGDATFIKIKLTIVNLIFFAILQIGVLMKRGWLKHILGHAVMLSEQHWITLSSRISYGFLVVAIANECVWRNFSDDLWVKYKVFVAGPLLVAFILFQMPFINKFGKIVTPTPDNK